MFSPLLYCDFCVLVSFSLFFSVNCTYKPDPKLYICTNGLCQALEVGKASNFSTNSLAICQLICDPSANLWPKPRGPSNFGRNTTNIALTKITVTASGVKPSLFDTVVAIFINLLDSLYRNKTNVDSGKELRISVNISAPNTSKFVLFKTDEAYSFHVGSCTSQSTFLNVDITSGTIYGARHGLETLSQIIVYDEKNKNLQILCSTSVSDSPAFPYRGVSLDVARHFYPVPTIMHQIDAMSYNKFNVLHLHISDTQAFPLHIPKWPELTRFGTYGPDKMYTLEDLQTLKLYAQNRGIAIVPEIDGPSHVGYGCESTLSDFRWQWGDSKNLGELLLCFTEHPTENCFGAPCGHLNLANQNVYKILADIYKNITEIFGPQATYHLGGDEVDLSCWKHNMQIQNWLKKQNLTTSSDDLYKVWAEFEKKILSFIQANVGNNKFPAIIWSSSLVKMHKNLLSPIKDQIIVQVWDPSSSNTIPDLVQNNFTVIASTSDTWYLNCGYPWWAGEGPNRCGPMKGWREMYNNRPYKGLKSKWNITDPFQKSLIVGGEVCLWSEITDHTNVDSDIWPRSAAVAERLWTDPSNCWWEANARFLSHRERLKSRGINAEPVAPEFCTQNPQHCVIPPSLWQHFNVTSSCEEFNQQTETTESHTTSSSTGGSFSFPLCHLLFLITASNMVQQ